MSDVVNIVTGKSLAFCSTWDGPDSGSVPGSSADQLPLICLEAYVLVQKRLPPADRSR
jgi:hypothetical protein